MNELLRPGEVQVWQCATNAIDAEELLSSDELAAAARFHFARDRNRYVSARSALRRRLAEHLRQSPKNVRFKYGEHGKPELAEPTSGIEFNVSHSQDDALIAIARGREVGIDIEHPKAGIDALSIADRFFTSEEIAFIRRHSMDQQLSAFLDCWTRKEAWMKALGVGLSRPTQEFDLSSALGKASAVLTIDGGAWTMIALPPIGAARAALVVAGEFDANRLQIFRMA